MKALLDANRHLRHNFMNYLQVISGYLQLGNVEKACHYVKESSDFLRSFDPVSRLRSPLVQAVLFHFMTLWNKDRRGLEVISEGDFAARPIDERNLAYLLMDILTSLEEYISCGAACQVKFFARESCCVTVALTNFNTMSNTDSLSGNFSADRIAEGAAAERFVVHVKQGPGTVVWSLVERYGGHDVL